MQLVNPQEMKVYESDTDLSESSQLMGTPLQTMNDLSRTGEFT